jgi:DNA polymerase-3 subunit alpha
MEAGKVCVIVSEATLFEPSPAEIEKAKLQAVERAERANVPLRLRLDAARLPASVIDDLKQLLVEHPGESEVVLEVATSAGARRLRLGSDFKVARSAKLLSELDQLIAAAILPAAPEPAGVA